MSFCFVVVVVCAAASWIAGAREVPLEQHIHSQQHEEAPNSPEVVQGDEEFEEEDGQVFWLLLVILSVQTTGWVSLNALCFWWMPFLDHAKLDWLFDTDAAFVGLALQAMVSFCLAGQVSVAWCRAWGETKLWLFGEGLMAMALGSTRWVDRNNPGLTVVVAGVTGIFGCMHLALIHPVIQSVVRDSAKRAFYIGVASNTLCVAQIVVAGFGGAIVQYVGGGNISVLFGLCAGLQALVLAGATPVLLLRPTLGNRKVQSGGSGTSECSVQLYNINAVESTALLAPMNSNGVPRYS